MGDIPVQMNDPGFTDISGLPHGVWDASGVLR